MRITYTKRIYFVIVSWVNRPIQESAKALLTKTDISPGIVGQPFGWCWPCFLEKNSMSQGMTEPDPPIDWASCGWGQKGGQRACLSTCICTWIPSWHPSCHNLTCLFVCCSICLTCSCQLTGKSYLFVFFYFGRILFVCTISLTSLLVLKHGCNVQQFYKVKVLKKTNVMISLNTKGAILSPWFTRSHSKRLCINSNFGRENW